MTPTLQCKICQSDTSGFGVATVLGKHQVQYLRCNACGFIQTETPYWLDESYSSVITNLDIGLVQRNLELAKKVSMVVDLFFDAQGRYIDYGGGYGLFVRLMRDRGLNFYWLDPFCENLFAKHFEADPDPIKRYDLLTAFEVFEHLVEPIEGIEQMTKLADNLMFSTILVPTPAPTLEKWWYYGLDHGQHVALYTVDALKILSQRLGLHFYTNGRNLHLFSKKSLNPRLFRLVTSNRLVRIWDFIRRRPSLEQPDYQFVLGKIRK